MAELGGGKEMKAALLKLSAALPQAQRLQEERVRGRFYVDWAGWFQHGEPVPHLQTLQQAVWLDLRLRLRTRSPFGGIVERTVDPLALVAKAGIWYLVYRRDGMLRVRRVSRLLDAQVTSEGFERPADFDLPAFWKSWCEEFEESRPTYLVKARLSPGLVAHLPQYFGSRIHNDIARAAPPDADGWLTLTLPFETLEAARERLLGFGRAVEVLEPLALRMSIIDFARQVVAFYEGRESG
jgi:predicted DNA-binding transcriptional regulator YafY